MASFSYVVLFAFFLLSSHLFARQLPNENRFSISNKPQWTIPLTATEITKDYDSTIPSIGYYSRDSNQDSNSILPKFFSKKKKFRKQPKTKTSPKTPPPDQNLETHHHEQVPHPHPPHYPPYQPNPYNDYNDPPNYYERRRPFGSNLPPITPFIEPFLRKPNQDDPESEDTDDDPESKNTDPESKKNIDPESKKIDAKSKSKKKTDPESKKTDPESKKSAPESKKNPPPDDEEEEDSLDNTAHLTDYYHPLGFENLGKRFQAAYNNMEEVDELKGSNNKLRWGIPFTPSKIEKDHFTTPSVGNYNPWNSHLGRTLILPMLFSSEKNQPKEPQTDPHGPHGPNIDPHGQHDPHTPNGQHSGQHGPHTSPHDPYNNDPYNGRHGPHTDPRDPYNNNPYNSRYGPHTGPRDRYDNPYDDPYDDDPYGSNTGSYPNRPRFIDPNDLPRIWETIKDTAKKGWKWLHPNPAKSSESPPSDEEKEDDSKKQEDSLDSTHFDQPSGFHDIENHEDGNAVWHHKMNNPSDIYWRTTHLFPTKVSPWTQQGGSKSYYEDNDRKENRN